MIGKHNLQAHLINTCMALRFKKIIQAPHCLLSLTYLQTKHAKIPVLALPCFIYPFMSEMENW